MHHDLFDRRISFEERNSILHFINRRFENYDRIAGKRLPISKLKPLFDCIGLKCESTGRHGSRQYIVTRCEITDCEEATSGMGGTEIDL